MHKKILPDNKRLYDGVEVWMNTAEYIVNGNFVAPCVVADCSSVKKARRMMKLYEETILVIEKAVGQKEVRNCL
jgi:hypothetical protein